MSASDGSLFSRWEREVREASVKGLEEVLPPVAEWPTFLLSMADPDLAAVAALVAGDTSAREALELALQSTPAGAGQEAGGADPSAAELPGGAANELPRSQLPDPLRAEIEEFLNKDKPAGPSDSEG